MTAPSRLDSTYPTTLAATDSMPTEGLEHARRRTTRLFQIAVAAGNTANVAAMTVTSLAAERIMSSATWTGVPMAAAILGMAAGTSILPHSMHRWGRRRSLIAAYCTAAGGAATAVAALYVDWFLLLVGGLFVLGCGQSASIFTRYLSADLQPVERRASAVSMIVWMGTVGAVVGPNLLAPSDRGAQFLGLPPLAGAYGFAFLAFSFAAVLYFVWLRPDPSALLWQDRAEATMVDTPTQGLTRYLREPVVQVALATLVFGHVVMVLIMSMTPLHVQHAGHGLGPIGLIASAHTLGMFAFSPLVGRWVDRMGSVVVIRFGLATLLTAALAAGLAPPSEPGYLFAALFLLGIGWNLGFVAGSALLSSGIPAQQRSSVQGLTDSLVWISAACASLLSGVVLATFGYQLLCWLAVVILAIPATVILTRGRLAKPLEARSREAGAS